MSLGVTGPAGPSKEGGRMKWHYKRKRSDTSTGRGADLGVGLAFDMLYGSSDVSLQVISSALVGDLDGDGFVGIDDLTAAIGNWNTGAPSSSTATIPEPARLVLLGICGVPFVGRK